LADPELLGHSPPRGHREEFGASGEPDQGAFWLSNLDIPVRLVAIPEGALQGFNDEVLDVDHTEFARTCAIDIPGRRPTASGASPAAGACS